MLGGIKERRKFERVVLPGEAKIFATSTGGKKIGPVSVLGRGGFQLETKKKFKVGESGSFLLVDPSEGIKREVTGVVRSVAGPSVGFEFEDLTADAAVEVGVMIGKYYSAANGE